PELVARGIEAQSNQQTVELFVAALNVADDVGGHVSWPSSDCAAGRLAWRGRCENRRRVPDYRARLWIVRSWANRRARRFATAAAFRALSPSQSRRFRSERPRSRPGIVDRPTRVRAGPDRRLAARARPALALARGA